MNAKRSMAVVLVIMFVAIVTLAWKVWGKEVGRGAASQPVRNRFTWQFPEEWANRVVIITDKQTGAQYMGVQGYGLVKLER